MPPESIENLLRWNRELQERLDEAEETLRALRSGEVDAVVAAGPDGDRVYTLKGADEAYRVMVQGMADGALTLTTDGLILFSNEQFATIVRTPLERVIGSRIQDFAEPEDVETVSAILGGSGRKAEARLKTNGATPALVYLSAENLVLDGIACLCLMVTDLSGQKRSQEILAAERLARSILEQAARPIMVVDPDGRIIRASRETEQLAGAPVLLHKFDEVFPISLDSGKEYPFREIMATLELSRTVKDIEVTALAPNGRKIELLLSAAMLLCTKSELLGCILHLTDITERKRAQERMLQTQKLESLGLLAGGLAHDFNNLLVGVIGNASLAQEMLPPGNDAGELLDGIIKTGEQLANLTRQMLSYSGKGRFLSERLDLSDLIGKTTGLVRPSIPKKIALQFQIDPELPPIEADRGEMQQVFMNLVLNASEAIGSNAGLISVKTGVQTVDDGYIRDHVEAAELSPGRYVSLEVRDNGCGMDAETKSKAFDPFFSTKFTGRGLGLAAVSGIVRAHEGAIQVTSELGQGSCFTVLFPAREAAPLASAGQGVPGAVGTVLVVDDEEMVRAMVSRSLTHHGFEVLIAKSGREAIEILKQRPDGVSLVVLDLSMPDMSGEETLPELRKIRPGIGVLVSSGYSEDETMPRFSGQPVSGFIQKPYTSAVLVEKIKSTLAATAQQRPAPGDSR